MDKDTRVEDILQRLPGIGPAMAVKLSQYLAAHPALALDLGNALKATAAAGACVCGMPASVEHPRPDKAGAYLCAACASEKTLPVAFVPDVRVADTVLMAGFRAFIAPSKLEDTPLLLERLRDWAQIAGGKTSFAVSLMLAPAESMVWGRVIAPFLRKQGVPIKSVPQGLPVGTSTTFTDPYIIQTVLEPLRSANRA